MHSSRREVQQLKVKTRTLAPLGGRRLAKGDNGNVTNVHTGEAPAGRGRLICTDGDRKRDERLVHHQPINQGPNEGRWRRLSP